MRARSLTWNVAANIAGRLWTAILTMVSVPVFARVLGPEAYGLIGLFASLNIASGILDLGLSATVNREAARNLAAGRSAGENASLLRTFESIYWATGAVIGVLTIVAARWVANQWVTVHELPRWQVESALRIMALCLAARWPVSLYSGLLQGLQLQVKQNGLLMVSSGVRTLGTLVVLLTISPTVTAFLVCQLLGNCIEVLLLMGYAWKSIHAPASARRFDRTVLQRTWRLALSFNTLGALGLFVSQVDRLVISKTLPLSELGYYAIGATAAGAVPLVATSLGAALFPRFSARTAVADRGQLVHDYHRAVQAVGFVGVAAGLGVALFPTEVLLVWLGHPAIVAHIATVLALLSIASVLNAVQNPAYNLLLAAGRTGIIVAVNAINVGLFLPLMVLVVPVWGIEGAAFLWMTQNVIFVFVYPRRVSQIVLHEPTSRRFMQDVLGYFALGVLWLGVARLMTRSHVGAPVAYVALLVAEVGYLVSSLALARRFDMFPTGLALSRQTPPRVRARPTAAEAQSAF